MGCLGELFDLDPYLDAEEDLKDVSIAKYRKRAPSYGSDQKPAKKQKTVKDSSSDENSEDELSISSRSIIETISRAYLSFYTINFVSGGIQYQNDHVEEVTRDTSYSRPSSGRGEDGDSEEVFEHWNQHSNSIGAKLLLQMGFQPGEGLGKYHQGRSTILKERDLAQGLSGQVCRYFSSGVCRYGLRCKHFHLETKAKTAEVNQGIPPQEVCRYFSTTGLCWYGNRCYYRHIKTTENAWECDHCGFINENLWSKYCDDCGELLPQFQLERN